VAFRLFVKETIPTVPPFYTSQLKYLQNILYSLNGSRKYNRMVYGAITHGWTGWTDGALWMINRLPNVNRRKETQIIYTNVIITRDRMLDYYRRYTYIGNMPSLRYRNIEIKTEHTGLFHEYMIFADPQKAILIPQIHIRILYHTYQKPLTFWIHPVLNCYTITQDNRIVAFGLGAPEYSYKKCINLVNMNKRRAVLQVRRWWETRIHKNNNKACVQQLFGWRMIKN